MTTSCEWDASEHTSGRSQFHWSDLALIQQCAYSFYLSKRLGLPTRSGTAALVGTSAHAVAAKNLKEKIQSGTLLPLEEVKDLARDATHSEWLGGVDLLPEEAERGIEAALGAAVDKTVRLASAHATRLAPFLRPARVEHSFVIQAEGFPWDIAGTRDLDEEEVRNEAGKVVITDAIHDYKTSAKMVAQELAGSSGQLSTYSVAYLAEFGRYPARVALDYTIDRKGGAVSGVHESVRRPEHIASWWQRLEAAADAIEKEVYLPSTPYVHWWCTERWCGHARINPDTGKPNCKYFSVAPTMVALPFNTEGESRGANKAEPEQRRSLIANL